MRRAGKEGREKIRAVQDALSRLGAGEDLYDNGDGSKRVALPLDSPGEVASFYDEKIVGDGYDPEQRAEYVHRAYGRMVRVRVRLAQQVWEFALPDPILERAVPDDRLTDSRPDPESAVSGANRWSIA